MRDLKIDELPQVYGAGGWGKPRSCHGHGGSTGKRTGSHKKSTHKRSTCKRSSKKHSSKHKRT